MKQLEVEIKNEHGIHARPAGLIINTVKKHESVLTIQSKDITVNASNIFEILSLGAAKGEKLTLIADGKDENELLEELKKLFEIDKFNEA